MQDQLRFRSYEVPTTPANLFAMIDGHGGGRTLRSQLSCAGLQDNLADYPELLLSFAVYHAAHRCYIADLKQAINQADYLSDDERDNATFTISTNSFSQFNSFLLFLTMLPLTLLYLKESDPLHPETPIPVTTVGKDSVDSQGGERTTLVSPERVKEAIGKAWQTFFKKNILTREYDKDGSLPENEEAKVAQLTCPARGHLQAASESKTLEGLYDFVLSNPEKSLDPFIEMSRQAANSIERER